MSENKRSIEAFPQVYARGGQFRCVNLDWLEVHCLEPTCEPHDAEFFRRHGLTVNERGYGTRVYRQMFTVCDNEGNPFVEIRRDPFSQGIDGIHTSNECHLRLVNAACYYDNAAELLSQFLAAFDYVFMRISRVDICLDFERFDRGDEPAAFLRRYLQGVYSKINQGNITAHGTDRWNGQVWNSVSWGAPTSDIGTKFYNKTQELYDASTNTYKKPHIRYSWYLAGLIDDFHHVTRKNADGVDYTPQIWRVEFSIRSSVKKWFAIELNGKTRAYQSIRNTLDMYSDRSKLLTLFASLANHYFHFKHYRKEERKDRCPDKVLFNWGPMEQTYKVGKEGVAHLLSDSRKEFKPLDTLIAKLQAYKATHHTADIHEACQVLIKAMQGETLRSELRNPFAINELLALQQALSIKAKGSGHDVAVLMREIKELLNINDKTAIF